MMYVFITPLSDSHRYLFPCCSVNSSIER